MASREGMLFNFFEKWKQKRLNKFAKKRLKDNPELEASLRRLDALWQETLDDLKKSKK